MTTTPELARGYFQRAPFAPEGPKIAVHFNPVSLQTQLQNTLENQSDNDETRQFVAQQSAKLSLELTFDSTDTGADVRDDVDELTALMNPDAERAPPIVRFRWGAFVFQGMIEQITRTLVFFSIDGVPLRATVGLAMARQAAVFDPAASRAGDGPPRTDVGGADGLAALDAATRAGDPGAARAVGAANGLASLRFGGEAGLGVGGGLQIGAAAGFSAGIGGGIGGGIGAGIGIGGGASVSGAVGGRSSAGVSAAAGAFGGLRAGAAPRRSRLDPQRLIADAAPRAGDTVAAGGRVVAGAGVTADVRGAAASRRRLGFDDR